MGKSFHNMTTSLHALLELTIWFHQKCTFLRSHDRQNCVSKIKEHFNSLNGATNLGLNKSLIRQSDIRRNMRCWACLVRKSRGLFECTTILWAYGRCLRWTRLWSTPRWKGSGVHQHCNRLCSNIPRRHIIGRSSRPSLPDTCPTTWVQVRGSDINVKDKVIATILTKEHQGSSELAEYMNISIDESLERIDRFVPVSFVRSLNWEILVFNLLAVLASFSGNFLFNTCKASVST